MKNAHLMLTLLLVPSAALALTPLAPSQVRVPPGFQVSLFATGVENARGMALGPDGTVYVGSYGAGKVYALPDPQGRGKADQVITLATGLDSPIGVAFKDGSLYVTEINHVLRYDSIASRLRTPPKPVELPLQLPTESHHGARYIAFGPDGLLYIGLGAPCNVCEPSGPRYGAIGRMRPDGTGFESFAQGVRNSVGFDWNPAGGDFWFTDNGRDNLGDDLPPDELNHAPRSGLSFGFPYCLGNGKPDPEFGSGKGCAQYQAPALQLGPHVASLGMKFIRGNAFPPEYRGSVLIAEHGSWNRSKKIGYRVSLARFRGGRPVAYEVFADGWLKDEKVSGRPVDILQLKDGSVLVSDDMSGAIYRIKFKLPPLPVDSEKQ